MKITKESYGRKDMFEVTDRIPSGYIVWNIGDNMVPGYLPVTMVVPGTYSIRPETLKAIPLPADELAVLRKVASRGLTCKAKAEMALKRGSKHVSPALVAKAVEIYTRISE